MKVLLTTDGSEAAEKAIRWFVYLSLHTQNTYEIITVENASAFGLMQAELYDEYRRVWRENARSSFERANAIVQDSGLNAIHVDRIGQASDEIEKYARESGTDLIVLGAHGASGLTSFLLGSTSDAVAMYASCSVLVVRDAVQDCGSKEPLRVTMAYDGSDAAKNAASVLGEFGLPVTTKLDLVSIIEHPPLLDPDMIYDVQLTKQTKDALQLVADSLRNEFRDIETHVIEKVHLRNGLLDALQNNRADLVVLGDKGRSAINRFFMGSVSRFILSNAPCSVFLSRKRLGS
ncbi:MAG: universal stress protein [Pirellulaceae bacterium]|nr:universal stress protein [Pirellulaceae bacterium]